MQRWRYGDGGDGLLNGFADGKREGAFIGSVVVVGVRAFFGTAEGARVDSRVDPGDGECERGGWIGVRIGDLEGSLVGLFIS